MKSEEIKLNSVLICTCIVLIFSAITAQSQPYIEGGKTRHRFAQLNLGMDINLGIGGNSKYLDAFGNIQDLQLNNTLSNRLVIGGTHFWGHADFYIAVPIISNSIKLYNQQIYFQRGVETAFKYYPLCIKNNKIRPYIGISLTSFRYKHINNNLVFPEGPTLNKTIFPFLSGITYNFNKHLLEFNFCWSYQNNFKYALSRDKTELIKSPSLFFGLSYKYMIETTLSAEKDWQSGKTQKITEFLEKNKRLNGLYFGAGISSVFWLSKGSYNITYRPYLEKFESNVLPDFSLGYYLNKQDINFAIAYRSYRGKSTSYGVFQNASRKSVVLEATKFLFDYHGFCPFIGPNAGFEKLTFTENFENNTTINTQKNKIAFGFTFGWDIRPNRIQSILLRTNLRLYPSLYLKTENNSKISFNNLEFNFIQLVIFPNRIIKRKNS